MEEGGKEGGEMEEEGENPPFRLWLATTAPFFWDGSRGGGEVEIRGKGIE